MVRGPVASCHTAPLPRPRALSSIEQRARRFRLVFLGRTVLARGDDFPNASQEYAPQCLCWRDRHAKDPIRYRLRDPDARVDGARPPHNRRRGLVRGANRRSGGSGWLDRAGSGRYLSGAAVLRLGPPVGLRSGPVAVRGCGYAPRAGRLRLVTATVDSALASPAYPAQEKGCFRSGIRARNYRNVTSAQFAASVGSVSAWMGAGVQAAYDQSPRVAGSFMNGSSIGVRGWRMDCSSARTLGLAT